MTISAVLEEEFISTPALPPSSIAVFVAVGSTEGADPPILITTEDTDATTWVDRSAAAFAVVPGAVLQDVCYSASLDRWVAVGYDNFSFGNPIIIYSDDGGNTWTAATPAPSTDFMIESVCWTGAAFIAVGHNSAFTGPKVSSSSDGITWTARTSDPTTTVIWHGVSGISGLAVAVGSDDPSPSRIMSSANDGTSWTQRTAPSVPITFLNDVFCSEDTGGMHVAVGLTSTSTRGAVATSSNGTTWTALTSGLPSDQQYYGVAYNGSIYVAVGMDDSTNLEGRAASSTAPASTWTARTTDPVTAGGSNGPNWLSVAAIVSGGFVAVGRDNNTYTVPYIMYSADGITWTARTSPVSGCILSGVGSTG